MRGMQAAFPTSGIHLIIDNVRQFDSLHFHHWAEGFPLVTELCSPYIPETAQGAMRPETVDVKISGYSSCFVYKGHERNV